MGENVKTPALLNLGCGFKHVEGYINVDAFENCSPDVLHDLNAYPYPWDDNSIDGIISHHCFEHLKDWWKTLEECARILKPGAVISIHVPHDSSSTALGYRDHLHVLTPNSFHGIHGGVSKTTNAWFEQEKRIPLKMIRYNLVPFQRYEWMAKWCPKLLQFCSDHLRNFIWEQQFHLVKIGDSDGQAGRGK